MSSYDLFFAARPDAAPPSIDALRSWLSKRPRWKVDETSAEYENPLTGLDLNAMFEADSDAPADRVPATLWIRGLRAHNAIEEATEEFEAFVAAFDLLLVVDRDENTKRPFDRAWLRAEHAEFNRSQHEFHFGHQANDHVEVLDRERLDEVIAWNRKRDALAEASGEDVFVPQILFSQAEDGVQTFVAWAEGTAARIPQVDAIQTTRAFVPWSVIAPAIATAKRERDHWLVTGQALAKVFAAAAEAPPSPPPTLVDPREVLTRDLVAAYLLPATERAARRQALEALHAGRMAGFMGRTQKEAVASYVEAADLVPTDFSIQLEATQFLHEKDPAEAVRIAERALSLSPTYGFVALIGAVNAMYAAQWDAALGFADRALAIDENDRNAHLVRATALTDLMRWDEAVLACDRAVAIEDDAMARNVKGFTLAAAGRMSEAEVTYTSALEALLPALAESPEDGDLHERRAYALLGLGRAKEALAAAKQAVKIDADNLLAWQSVGRAAIDLGKAPDAIKALRKVMAKRPAPMAAFHLARAHALASETKERDAALALAAKSPLYARLAATDAILHGTHAPPEEPATKKPGAKKKK